MSKKISRDELIEENARLIDKMKIVNDIGISLTSGIRLKEAEILEMIYRYAQRLTGTLDMYIALYDNDTQTIRFGLATEHGTRVKYASRKANMNKRGLTEDIIFTHQPILHKTAREAMRWYGQAGHQEFVGFTSSSWLGVPMMIGEKVIGVIAVYDIKHEYAYDELDLQIFSSMASQAAIALDNASLYYNVNQGLESLVAFGQKITSKIGATENEIIEEIYHHASQSMDTSNMFVALYDAATDVIRFPLMFVDGKPKEILERQGDFGRTEIVIQTQKPILSSTKAENIEWYEKIAHKEYIGGSFASWIGVPMMVENKVLGVIATYHPELENLYNEYDLDNLKGIASLAAIALENSRLFEGARGDVIAAKQLSTLGTAIAALQHRINNTFNIIIPNVTRLRSRVDLENAETVEILDIIERNARYTSAIIERIQDPLKEVEITTININAILDDVISHRKILSESDRLISIEFSADENIPTITGPSGQIAEVFDNLISNAYKAMPNGGEIQVKSELNKGMICVEVTDSGYGISSNVQKRLFKKPVPSHTPGGGAGLGLWLSLLMLQSIGGNINIKESNEKGTTMLVTIPVLQSN